MPQIFRLVTFLLDEAENDARGRLKRLKRFGTFEETHANLYVAHQAKKRRRGCVPSQKVAEVAGCMSKVARGPHQAKKLRQKSPEVRTKPERHRARFQPTKMSVFGFTRGNAAQRSDRKPEENQRNDQNQPNPGLIGQDVKKSLTGGGWQTWVTYTRLPGYPGV